MDRSKYKAIRINLKNRNKFKAKSIFLKIQNMPICHLMTICSNFYSDFYNNSKTETSQNAYS